MGDGGKAPKYLTEGSGSHGPLYPRPGSGHTSSRAILFDREAEHSRHGPEGAHPVLPPGGLGGARRHGDLVLPVCCDEVIAQTGISPKEIAAIGITNQRETTVLWDRATGRPIHNAIVWQCRRTAPLVDELTARGLAPHIRPPPASSPTPTSPPPKSSGFSMRWRGPGRRPSGGKSSSAR